MKKLVFLGLRRFSNLNVLHKGLLMQDWVFRLGFCLYFGAIIYSNFVSYEINYTVEISTYIYVLGKCADAKAISGFSLFKV